MRTQDGTGSAGQPGSSWQAKYSDAHALRRVETFPEGVRPPGRVRVYARGGHYVLQWWQKSEKRTLSQRVDGDLIDAVALARTIDLELDNYGAAAGRQRKLKHADLVTSYVADLGRRADAGELAASTVTRYQSALEYYLAFINQPQIRKSFPDAVGVKRNFQSQFAAHLQMNAVRPSDAAGRAVRSPGFVLDTARAMFEWAADSNRGGLLPAGFQNPFRRAGKGREAAKDLLGEPDITVDMAVRFFERCDRFQLRLFATLALYGLRAAEPVFLLSENVGDGWLKVPCLPEIAYATKGIRAKTFPLFPPMVELIGCGGGNMSPLVFVRRAVFDGRERPKLIVTNLKELVEEFRCRCNGRGGTTAADREAIRDAVLRDGGGLNYDQIEHEFRAVAQPLGWPPAATLKDFRHLFSSCLENSGVSLYYRRYLMGQSPGRTAITTYTHLNQVRGQYQKAVDGDLSPIVAAISERARHLTRQVA